VATVRAWGFYGHRVALYRKTVPHAGFELLRRWGDAMPNGYFVFTSNVDGHFQKAGFNPLRIDECHGSIHYLQCLEPCSTSVWDAGTFNLRSTRHPARRAASMPALRWHRASEHPDVR
jgi:NAD-dependent SIR2 family protein deacetylase